MSATAADERVAQISRAVIAQVEPVERDLVEVVLVDSRRFWRPRSGALGYGIEAAGALLSPYVVVAATWAAGVAFDEARQSTDKRIRKLVRRLLRDVDPDTAEKALRPLSEDPLDSEDFEVNVRDFIRGLGLDRDKAQLIAEAVVMELRVMRDKK